MKDSTRDLRSEHYRHARPQSLAWLWMWTPKWGSWLYSSNVRFTHYPQHNSICCNMIRMVALFPIDLGFPIAIEQNPSVWTLRKSNGSVMYVFTFRVHVCLRHTNGYGVFPGIHQVFHPIDHCERGLWLSSRENDKLSLSLCLYPNSLFINPLSSRPPRYYVIIWNTIYYTKNGSFERNRDQITRQLVGFLFYSLSCDEVIMVLPHKRFHLSVDLRCIYLVSSKQFVRAIIFVC